MRVLKYTAIMVFLGMTACAFLKAAREIIAVKNLKITLLRLEITGVGLDGINSTLYINAENPNKVSAKIVSFDFDILVNSEKITHGDFNNTVIIPPKSRKTLKVPVYLPFSGMSSAVKRVLLNKSAELGIKGYMVINTEIGMLKFKVIDRTDRIF